MEDSVEPAGIEQRLRLQNVRIAFQTFIASVGYDYYVKGRSMEISNTEELILMVDPEDRKTEIESFKLRGDLRTTREYLTLFEDTISRLDDRIAELQEAEQPTDTIETT